MGIKQSSEEKLVLYLSCSAWISFGGEETLHYLKALNIIEKTSASAHQSTQIMKLRMSYNVVGKFRPHQVKSWKDYRS